VVFSALVAHAGADDPAAFLGSDAVVEGDEEAC
jgi:hypothetical protein